ncbi:MAG TPA: 5-oxoprolinase subunit PxpB [Azospirillum sp.]|nr:5-oxoprolinase subunit PxpB [Azospirillum sp.]
MNETGWPRLLPQGDAALVVELGDRIDRHVSERVTALADAMRRAAIAGVVELVPTFRSLLVHYDPLILGFTDIAGRAQELLAGIEVGERRLRLVHMPACYDEDLAPDLADVAAQTGMTPVEVVRLHGSVDYHVYMLGFLPGFPYMGDLPDSLRLPRLTTPRVRVPPRSIAIANAMTAVYPLESPGGWRLIGAVPVDLFDIGRDPPALLGPGDRVRFEPVERAAFDDLRAAWAAGEGALSVEEVAA